MKTSRIAAKVIVRLFLFLTLLALVPVFNGNINTQLQHIYITATNKWVFVFPALLLIGFITLFILSTIKKYSETDINWLLVLNTTILIAYGVIVFIRISHLIK